LVVTLVKGEGGHDVGDGILGEGGVCCVPAAAAACAGCTCLPKSMGGVMAHVAAGALGWRAFGRRVAVPAAVAGARAADSDRGFRL